jgi:phosphohistidine swiveling domain-containing protein
MITLSKEDIDRFAYFATRPMSMQREMMAVHIFNRDGHMSSYLSVPYAGSTRELFVDKEGMERTYQAALAGIDSFEKWEAHLEEYAALKEEMLEVTRSLKELPIEDSALFRTWLETLKRYCLILVLPLAIEEHLEEECKNLLEQEGIPDLYEAIASPEELHDFQRMRLGIIEAWKGEMTIEELVMRFHWYSEYAYIEPPLDEDHFRKEIEKITAESAEEELQAIEGIPAARERFEEALARIKGDRLRLLATIIHRYTFLRTERIDILKRSQFRLRSFFAKVADLCQSIDGKPWRMEEVANLTDNEIIAVIDSQKVPDHQEVGRRLANEHLYYYDGQDHVTYDQTEQVKAFLQERHRHEEVVGRPAFKGIVKGRVVIVRNKDELGKVREGDVLVAKTTMPDYLPAMRLAVAFVTDEGGVTSHAAIVSRELQKPCIVGTKNATNVLKDGDMVEVDAEKGVVRRV